MQINTCLNVEIAYYTHLMPILVALFLSIYLLVKTNRNLLSKIFFGFTLSFSIWLVFDLIAWTPASYHLISTVWSLFDYMNVIFFLFGLYFFSTLALQKDIEWQWKLFGFILTLFPLYRILSGSSVVLFDQSVCEAWGDDILTIYKNYIEGFVIFGIILFGIWTVIKKKTRMERNQVVFIGAGLLLFFVTFAGTDYLSVQTGIYEIGLYGLFVLPVFLGLIVYAIVKYKAFNVGVLVAQVLVVTLNILVAAQFFFIQNTTNLVMNAITLLLSLIFGYFLVRGIKRDLETRKQLEKFATDLQQSNDQLENANVRLKELDQQKTEFISLATHQIRGPLGAIKGHASLALEGDYGNISSGAKKAFETIMHSAQGLVVVVNDYLDVSRIEQGRMKYDFSDFDLKDLAKETVNDFLATISNNSLALEFICDQSLSYITNADKGKIKQVLGNLIDNSVKYTLAGHIRVSLEKKAGKLLISIKDTGVGITPEVLPNLFTKFSRAPDASKTNILGTGLGLYVAKKIIEAHKGRVWAESEGQGKGSQFYMELDEKK